MALVSESGEVRSYGVLSGYVRLDFAIADQLRIPFGF